MLILNVISAEITNQLKKRIIADCSLELKLSEMYHIYVELLYLVVDNNEIMKHLAAISK